MPRAIYQKAIYKRKKQMDRAVYRRANNVLPITEASYGVSNVVLGNSGTGYHIDDVLTITGGEEDTAATITVTNVTPTTYTLESVTITDGGAGYAVNDTFDVDGDDETDTSGLVTVTEVYTSTTYIPNSDPSSVTITSAGSGFEAGFYYAYNSLDELVQFNIEVDQDGKVTSISPSGGATTTDLGTITFTSSDFVNYTGSGTGLEFSMEYVLEHTAGEIKTVAITQGGEFDDSTFNIVDNSATGSGAVLTGLLGVVPGSAGVSEFTFTAGEYATDLSGTFALDSATGTGATFVVTMEPVETVEENSEEL